MVVEINNSSLTSEAKFDAYLLAGRSDTGRAMIRALSVSPNAGVRERVAENQAAPHVVLRALSLDESVAVRIAVAHNPRTPWTILCLLARDINADVRLAMAENPHLPLYLLSILAGDDNPYVSQRSRKTIAARQADGLQRLKAALKDRILELTPKQQPCA